MHDDVFVLIEFADAVGELAERDQARAVIFQVGDLPFVRLRISAATLTPRLTVAAARLRTSGR